MKNNLDGCISFCEKKEQKNENKIKVGNVQELTIRIVLINRCSFDNFPFPGLTHTSFLLWKLLKIINVELRYFGKK